jgi:hypothetical protein
VRDPAQVLFSGAQEADSIMNRKVAFSLGVGCAMVFAFATGVPAHNVAAQTVYDQSSTQPQSSSVTAPTNAPESPAAPLLVIIPSAIVGAIWAGRRHRAPPV